MVIDYLLGKDWEYDNVDGEAKRNLPPLTVEEDCVVRFITGSFGVFSKTHLDARTAITGNMVTLETL